MASALTYIERLLDEPYVQEEVGHAASRLRDAYGRASARRARDAVQDQKLYAQVRDAATSLVSAVRVLGGEPPPKHRGRRLVVLLGLGAVVAIAANEGLRTRLTGALVGPASGSDNSG